VLKEKGKYDVAVGTQKTSEELVKYWQELLAHYPSVIAIIDPLRKQVTSVSVVSENTNKNRTR